jgi:FkbM family methyltransferase
MRFSATSSLKWTPCIVLLLFSLLAVSFAVVIPASSVDLSASLAADATASTGAEGAGCPEHCARRQFIYLDVGSNRGDTIRNFFLERSSEANNPNPFRFPYDPRRFRVVAFEPLRSVHEASLTALQEKYPFEIVWAAAGTSDTETVRIYHDDDGREEWAAGIKSLFSERYEEVPQVDLSAWLRRNVRLEDEVLIKMNIEGAEFAILDKMIADGTLCLLDKAHIYFHPHFFNETGEMYALDDRMHSVYGPHFDLCGIYKRFWR